MKQRGVLKLPTWAAGLISLAMFAVLVPAGFFLVDANEWAGWAETATTAPM